MSATKFPEYLRRIQDVHRPPLSAREHKHTPDGIMMILPPTLEQVIDEILNSLGS